MTNRPDDPTTLKGSDPAPPSTLEGSDPIEAVAERLAAVLADDWRSGRRRRVEDLLEGHPEVRDQPRAAVRLIYEEICLRLEDGPAPSTVEMLGRFPRYRDELRMLLAGHHLLEEDRDGPRFPQVGEVLGHARLLAELGRGALGRVFLATQPDLADRPVVLKVSPRRGDEHLSLARLQHPNIVPLYGMEEFPALGLRVLCMPYLGAMTLARLADALDEIPPAGRTGADILDALDDSRKGLPVEIPAIGPARTWLARASHVQAVVWMGGCLARALHHAHERGLVHLDIKPSNVLLAADGLPMLLDFHLARRPIHPDDPPSGLIGGTPTYMSPEQAEALDRARSGQAPRSVVDGRSDLYSLGLVLYQAIGGPRPAPSTPRLAARALRRSNRRISKGLADLLVKCLEPDPRDRYSDASALAEDLRRHLADLPLLGVSNRSPVERWRKWRRRRPHALALIAMGLVVATAAALAVAATWVGSKPRPVVAIEADPAATRARRVQDADHLARTVANLRAGLAPGHRLTPPAARELAGLCRDVWANRERFLDATAAPLPDPTERRIRADLIELVALSIDLEARSALDDPAKVRRDGLRRIDEAVARLGPSPELDRARSTLLTPSTGAGPTRRP